MNVKNRVVNAGILAAVFIVAVMLFSFITNRGTDDMTADMGAASYPQVSFSCAGYRVNTLPGYAKRMEISSMRDTITPVINGKLEMSIDAYGNKIKKAVYNVYSLNGKEKLLKNKIAKPGESEELSLKGTNLLTEEKVLEIVLHLKDDKTVYFYTRVVDGADKNAVQCLDYIRDFHENALKKEEGSGIGTAIEPTDKGDNSTFQTVTINSDYDQVTWGDLEPSVEGGERWNIKEINGTSASVELEYRVRCKGEENKEDVYKAREFFRVRYSKESDKTFLLDYNRTMDQIFDPVKKVLSEKGILLGIAPYNVQYMVNGDGTNVSFVQANELWNYNKKTDEIAQIFSFQGIENTDERNMTPQYEIKLLDADKAGNATFAVYGYMNRGEHEGMVGVAIYYYNIEKSSVEEKVFISSNKSYGTAIHELGKLVYYNTDKDMLYVMVDGSLYEINVKKKSRDVIVKGLADNQYVTSDDGRIVAYQTGSKAAESRKVEVMNFASGKKRSVTVDEGKCVLPLGFVKNDFVYGVANTSDAGETISGATAIPMYKVEIQNSKSKVIKTYEQEGIYVLGAVFEEKLITLNRAKKDGNSYHTVSEDYITNNEKKEESNIYLETYVTELKESQTRITYDDGISDKEPKTLKPKQVLFENPTTITFDDIDLSAYYYVYGHGKLQGIYETAGAAITSADELGGVVTDAGQGYIWERGNRDLKYQISGQESAIASLRDLLNRGTSAIDAANQVSGDKGMDLTGCTTEEMLYIINQGTSVIGMKNGSSAVILVGYDENYVTYIDAENGSQTGIPFAQMDEMLGETGRVFVSYSGKN